MARLKVYLLGTFQVELDGQPVTRAFRTEKERSLLAFLLMESGRSASREALAELFWPDKPAGKARANLRQALTGIRRVLDTRSGARSFLISDEEQLQFDRSSDYWLDVQAFRGLLRAVLEHTHPVQSSCQECARKLESAIQLYRGHFLDDFYGSNSIDYKEWLVSNREQLFRYMLTAMKNLSQFYESQQQVDLAIEINRQHIDLDPLDELPRRKLMRLYALSGLRSLALEQYRIIQENLSEQLGVQPSTETTALYEQIKSGSMERRDKTTPLPSALKARLTSFIGREAELERLKDCVPNPACRLLTLVGLPGIGKTRLAQQALAQYSSQFKDGVWTVALEHVLTAEALAQAIADSGELVLNGVGSAQSALVQALAPVNALLFLDGFEHLIDQSTFLLEILQNAPKVKILVTSRERLQFQAACLFNLDGLAFPARADDPEAAGYPAVQLFTNRAMQSRSRYRTDENKLPDIVRICKAVQGHPLAIELAASNLRRYSTLQLADQLEKSSSLLSTNLQDVPERHRNLAGLFDQVWEQLAEAQRSACWALMEYEEDFEIPAAAAALKTLGDPEELLSSLVVKSILQETGAGKYQVQRIFRQYLLDRSAIPGTIYISPNFPERLIPVQEPELYDDLTGLVNAQLFWDRLRHNLHRAQRHPEQFAVGVIDLSLAYYRYNLDPAEKSALLKFVSEALTGCLRQEDTLARLGAGEIGCILEYVADDKTCKRVFRRIQGSLEGQVDLGSRLIQLEVRVACSVYSGGNITAEDLLARVRQEIPLSH